MNSCDKYATESNLTMNCCFSPHCSNDTRLGLMHLWGALKCGPKVLLQTGIGGSTPEKHLGVSQGTTALFCTQDALDGTWQQQPAAVLPPLSAPAGSETIGAFTPLRPTPGCTLRTGRPGWPAAAPWRAGRPPGPGASLWWSLSSARRPLLTPGRRWNFDRMELLSVPAGKTWSRGDKKDHLHNVGGQEYWCERGKHLPQTLLARPIHGTVGGSFHTRCLDRETHRTVSVYPELLGDVFMSSCLLSAPWMSCCPALTCERNSLRNLRPRRSQSRASVAELRTRATSFWTSCRTMDWSVGKPSGSDISFWWIFYMVERHGGMLLANVYIQRPNAQWNPDDRFVSMLRELDLSRKSTHTLIFPTKSILTGANTVDPSLSEERKPLIISSFSFNQCVMSSWSEHFHHVCWR